MKKIPKYSKYLVFEGNQQAQLVKRKFETGLEGYTLYNDDTKRYDVPVANVQLLYHKCGRGTDRFIKAFAVTMQHELLHIEIDRILKDCPRRDFVEERFIRKMTGEKMNERTKRYYKKEGWTGKGAPHETKRSNNNRGAKAGSGGF